MKVEWTDPALGHLDELHDYIAIKQGRPLVAERVVDEVYEASRPLALQPRMGRRIPEVDEEAFERIVKGYRLMYIIDEKAEKIFVVAVVSSYRSLDEMEPKPWKRT